MAWLLTLANSALFVLTLRLSRTSAYGAYRYSALNPVFLIAVFLFNCALLFHLMPVDKVVSHPRFDLFVDYYDKLYAYSVFTFYNLTTFLGFLLSFVWGRQYSFNSLRPVVVKRTHIVWLSFWVFSLALLCLYYLAMGVRSFSDVQTLTADRFNQLAGASYLIYLFALYRVILVIHLANIKPTSLLFWLSCCFAILLMLPSGSRLNMFSVILAMFFALKAQGAGDLRRLYFMLSLPLLGVFSLVARFYSRAFDSFESVSELWLYLGGAARIFFNPLEFHLHHMLTALVAFDYRSVSHRLPGESIVGLLTLPVPRSIFPVKPVSVSSEFTEYLDPNLWYSVRSQATLGFFGETYIEFGVLLGGVILVLFGYFFSRLSMRACKGSSSGHLIMLFSLALTAFAFTRGGIMNLGLILWPLFMVYIAIVFLERRQVY